MRVTKENFLGIDLARIEKKVYLKNLGAQVSSRPDELQAVKPLVEFDMVDKRFVEQSDVFGDFDSRPHLMDLNPFEFENLVSNLFSKMRPGRPERGGSMLQRPARIMPAAGCPAGVSRRWRRTSGNGLCPRVTRCSCVLSG